MPNYSMKFSVSMNYVYQKIMLIVNLKSNKSYFNVVKLSPLSHPLFRRGLEVRSLKEVNLTTLNHS